MKKEEFDALGYAIRKDNQIYSALIKQFAERGIKASEVQNLVPNALSRNNWPKSRTTLAHKSIIIELDFYFSLDLKQLILNEDEEEKALSHKTSKTRYYFQNEDYINVLKHNPNTKCLFSKKIDLNSDTTNQSLSKAYQTIISFVKNAKRHITAHEVLFKGSNMNPGKNDAYVNAQTSLLEQINNLLVKPEKNIRYVRYFHLSPFDIIFPIANEDNMSKAWILQTSLSSFTHTISLLNVEGVSFNLSLDTSFQSYLIIDNEYLVIEDYINLSGNILPSHIAIYQISDSASTYQESVLNFEKKSKHRPIFDIGESAESILEKVLYYLDLETNECFNFLTELFERKKERESVDFYNECFKFYSKRREVLIKLSEYMVSKKSYLDMKKIKF